MGTTLPGADELAALARETAKRCGAEVGSGVTTTSPINGLPLAAVDWVDATAVDEAAARAREARSPPRRSARSRR
ncbi:hypothetical protein ACQEVF_01535 [Nonomuraea polychroma]|uniref:hypothetical protein n=1 Tax=Nonomuraea polychroma TaxID=46176 RepID=UPI003D89BF8F